MFLAGFCDSLGLKDFGVLGFWDFGALGFGGFGVLGFWGFKVFGFRGLGLGNCFSKDPLGDPLVKKTQIYSVIQ